MLKELDGLLKFELCLIKREDIYDKTNKLLEYFNKIIPTLDEDDSKRYEIDSDLRSIFYCLANLNVDVVRAEELDCTNISYYTFMFVELIDSLWKNYELEKNNKLVL